MSDRAYQQLAARLDELPNGFPKTDNGAELRLLKKLFSPEEASLAAKLRLNLETADQIAARLANHDLSSYPGSLKQTLKGMARKGLIKAGKIDQGVGFGLLPFVVGIYEMQLGRIDEELAQLFEDYYLQAFGEALNEQPKFHRVVPVKETISVSMEVHPYESASEIVNQSRAWGVMDCICRKQKALLGDPCNHPLEMCMVFSPVAGAFDHSDTIRAMSQEQALETLHKAAQAGLVHTVSNTRAGNHYICNCCTCSCGILRGMADMGIANVVARSAFVNKVDEELCMACETCVDYCQFDALHLDHALMQVDTIRCVGCGVCVPACPEAALALVRRPESEILVVPESEDAWLEERAMARGIDINRVL